MRCEDCRFFFLLEHARKSKIMTNNNTPAPTASPIMTGAEVERDGGVLLLLSDSVVVGGDFLNSRGGGGGGARQ